MKYIKTNRNFTVIKKYSFTMILVIAGLGFIYPVLGLLLLPIMAFFMLLSLFKGKYWCGNLCPHGSLFDGLLLPFSKNGRIAKFFKLKPVEVILFILFAFMMVLRIKKVFETGNSNVYDKVGIVFVTNYFLITIISSLISIFNSSRSWCKICPMGTMQKYIDKISNVFKLNHKTNKKITLEDKEKCVECNKCIKVCPMQIEVYKDLDKDNKLASDDCIKCQVCVTNCPTKILQY